MIDIYTDGSYKNGVVGWGIVILVNDGTTVFYQGSSDDPELSSMRNVGGELMGVLYAMEKLDTMNLLNSRGLCFHYDYTGIRNWVTEEWKANKIFTQYYHDHMHELQMIHKCDYMWKKVKAHSGDRWNETADRLAREAIGL